MTDPETGTPLGTDPAWTIQHTYRDATERRRSDSLFTLGAHGYATGGAAEDAPVQDLPSVLVSGVFNGAGTGRDIMEGPGWSRLAVEHPTEMGHRVLDLHAGVLLREELGTDQPIRTMRFVSAQRPGVMILRAEGPTQRLHPGDALYDPAGRAPVTRGRWPNGWEWARSGADRNITAVARQYSTQRHGHRTVERFVGYSTESVEDAAERVRDAVHDGFDVLLEEHRKSWAQRWQVVDIAIPDDADTERAARFNLFQLWCNVGGRPEAAVGARGVSGHGYAGHVLWDTEVFVLPAIVGMDPELASAILNYRLHRLDAAREVARASGHRGARFPWESAQHGRDVTPETMDLGPWRVPVKTGEQEEHITSDVAWAVWYCAQWTGEEDFWLGRYRDLLLETARYWVSRIRLDSEGTAHIDDVIGPDEYHVSVSDNAFTNVLVRWHLRTAAEIAGGRERTHFRDLAARIVDGYDPATGIFEQFRGYFRLEPLTVAELQHPASVDSQFPPERIAATQLSKQPDVLMLHFLIPEEVPPESLVPNLEWYLPRTAQGSSLSPGIHAYLLARAGRADEALGFLRQSLHADLEHHGGSPEGGLHVGAMGSSWQSLLCGFLGVRVRNGVLSLAPVLPSDWQSLSVRFHCLGRRVYVRVGQEADGLTVDAEVSGPLWVRTAGVLQQVRKRARWTTEQVSPGT